MTIGDGPGDRADGAPDDGPRGGPDDGSDSRPGDPPGDQAAETGPADVSGDTEPGVGEGTSGGPAPAAAIPAGKHSMSAGDRSRPSSGLWGRLMGGTRGSNPVFVVLGILLCMLLGVAIVTQVRHNDSGDALETARPADLLVLLDSLRQREAALNTEVADLRQTLNTLQQSGNSDSAAIENAEARLAALAIMTGTVGATGPGVTVVIDDPAHGVTAEVVLDVVNELRAAGAEAMEIRDGDQGIRVGVDTWVVGAPGELEFDGKTLAAPYSILAIGDAATLAAAMNIPGGAIDAVRALGGTMTVQQSERVDVTLLRQPKSRQYAQPGK